MRYAHAKLNGKGARAHEEIRLPFTSQPVLATLLYTAYRVGILGNDAPSILNTNINLFYYEEEDTRQTSAHAHLAFHPRVFIRDYGDQGDLRVQDVFNAGNVEAGLRDVMDTVAECIGRQEFVYCHADLFYVPPSAAHLKYHYWHELLLVGDDRTRKSFMCATYDKSGQFVVSSINYGLLAAAILSPYGKHRAIDYCRDYRLSRIFRNADARFEVNPSAIRLQVQAYLDSSEGILADIGDGIIRSWIEGDRTEITGTGPSKVFGCAVYDGFSRQLRALGDPRRLDMRFSRMLWEHKKLMEIRIATLVKRGCIADFREHRNWESVVRLAHWIHFSCHMLCQSTPTMTIPEIRSALTDLRNKEAQVLEALVRALR